jgi:hypothetical protein
MSGINLYRIGMSLAFQTVVLFFVWDYSVLADRI